MRLQLWRRRVWPVETVDSAIRCSKLSKSLCPLRLDLDFIVSSNLLVFRRREPQRKGSQPDSRRTGEIFGKFISPIANCNSTPSGSQAKRKLVRQKENRCTKESEEAYGLAYGLSYLCPDQFTLALSACHVFGEFYSTSGYAVHHPTVPSDLLW